MKQKLVIIVIIILALIGLAWLVSSNNKNSGQNTGATAGGNGQEKESTPPPAYASDSAHIVAEVVNLEKREKGEFMQVNIKQIIAYSRDPQAGFNQLQVGDTVEAYLAWGSAPRTVTLDLGTKKEVIELAGLKAGDMIDANIAGCPESCNSGYGWTVYAYKSPEVK